MTASEYKQKIDDKCNITIADIENAFNVFLDKNKNYVLNINSTVCFPNINNIQDSCFSYFAAKENMNWPFIAYELYGSTRYAWLLLKLNNIKNALTKPYAGQTILYIPKEKIETILNAIAK